MRLISISTVVSNYPSYNYSVFFCRCLEVGGIQMTQKWQPWGRTIEQIKIRHPEIGAKNDPATKIEAANLT